MTALRIFNELASYPLTTKGHLAFLCLVPLSFCGPAFAQSDAISVTVSRNVALPPDAVYFSLAIATDPDITLEKVLEAGQALGITAQNLTSVAFQQDGP